MTQSLCEEKVGFNPPVRPVSAPLLHGEQGRKIVKYLPLTIFSFSDNILCESADRRIMIEQACTHGRFAFASTLGRQICGDTLRCRKRHIVGNGYIQAGIWYDR
jgi:hypothetical protein